MPQVLEPKLGVGQRLELELNGGWYASRVEDIGAELIVAWPTDRDRLLLPVQTGTQLRLAATAADDGLYSAAASVEKAVQQPLPLIAVRIDGPWTREQRRQDVRVNVAIKPRVANKIAVLQRPQPNAPLADSTSALRGHPAERAFKPVRAGLINLSAGGVRVRSQDELRHGDRLELVFALMSIGEIDVQAHVERVERQDRGSLPVWEAGCAFDDIHPRTTERIVQFIFAQQRALARARRS